MEKKELNLEANKLTLKEIQLSIPTQMSELVDVINEHYPDRSFPVSAMELLNSGASFFKAFDKQGQWVGVTGIQPKTIYLVETVKTIVFSLFRGQGYGEFLSRLIEEECFKRGYGKVMTTIYAHNHPMLMLKIKQGYRIEGFHPDHERLGFSEYSLGKIFKK